MNWQKIDSSSDHQIDNVIVYIPVNFDQCSSGLWLLWSNSSRRGDFTDSLGKSFITDMKMSVCFEQLHTLDAFIFIIWWCNVTYIIVVDITVYIILCFFFAIEIVLYLVFPLTFVSHLHLSHTSHTSARTHTLIVRAHSYWTLKCSSGCVLIRLCSVYYVCPELHWYRVFSCTAPLQLWQLQWKISTGRKKNWALWRKIQGIKSNWRSMRCLNRWETDQ